MSELKIGFIGVGGVAQAHLNNLHAMGGVSVAAVCDIIADRAQEVGAKFSASVYTDYHQMLDTQQLDGVYVCLIPGVHGTIEAELAQKRMPFYIEKPVHLDLDACQRVLDELEKHPTLNSVGYHWRYGAGAQAAKKFLADKKVSIAEGYWYGSFVGAPWWRQMKLSGGQLVEQTTHVVDMARFLAGEIKTVYAVGATGAMTEIENYDIQDTSIATLTFDSGAIGQITSGCIAEKHGAGQNGITIKGRNFNVWTNSDKAKWDSESDTSDVTGGQSWGEQLGNGDRAFIAAIQSGDQSKIVSDYRSGAQTLAVTLAGNQCMASGEVVTVRRFV